jgi:hypothetical protein
VVNKLLIGVGIVALVAVGSVGVLMLADGDDRRVGALGPLEKPISLAWRGSWVKDAEYQAGEVVFHEGSSYVAETRTAGDTPNAEEGPWALMAAQGVQGPAGAQGAAGAFNGAFQSPDGKYSIVVANTGIVMEGPAGTIKLLDTGVELKINKGISVKADHALALEAGTEVKVRGAAGSTVESSGITKVKGSVLHLNCSGPPIARVGDMAVGAPQSGQYQIMGPGSPTVLTC